MFDAQPQYNNRQKTFMPHVMKFVRALLFTVFIPATVLAADSFSGSYQLTVNGSVLGRLAPSTGHRLLLSYEPSFGSFDNRLEYYTDGSYNSDPPGELIHNINEPKLEEQLMYTLPSSWHGLGFTAGGLYHENFRFVDHYFWGVAGPTFSLPLTKAATATFAVLGENKCWTGRLFYDFSSEIDYHFIEKWTAFAQLHRYENLGQSDPAPTQKREYELWAALSLRCAGR